MEKRIKKNGNLYISGQNTCEINLDNPVYTSVLKLLNKLNTKPYKKYLDVGCRDGQFTKVISERLHLEAYGVDNENESVVKPIKMV